MFQKYVCLGHNTENNHEKRNNNNHKKVYKLCVFMLYIAIVDFEQVASQLNAWVLENALILK